MCSGLNGAWTDPVYHDRIMQGLDLAMRLEYDSAGSVFQALIDTDPQYPAGYLFQASVMAARFYDKNDTSSLPRFYRTIDSVLAKTVAKEDVSDRFYWAAALSFKALILLREQKWWEGAKAARQSATRFQALLDDGVVSGDILGILGIYHYWSSHALRGLAWLPFIEDKREQGRTELKRGFRDAPYLWFAIANSLLWIYYDRRNFTDALAVCDTVLARYPGHRIFRQAKVHVLYKLNRFQEALGMARALLSEYEGVEEVPVNWTSMKSKIAMIHYSMGDTRLADAMADSLLARRYDPYIEAKLKRDFHYLRNARNRENKK